MSLVLEALEKAQSEKIKQEKPTSVPVQILQKKEKPQVTAKPLTINKHKYRNIISILLVANASLFFLNWRLNTNSPSTVSTVVTNPSDSVPQISVIENILSKISFPIDASETLPSVNVTGIVWDSKEPIALVNSKFLKKGDEIKGAKIVDIQLNEVKFLYKDKEFTVSVE